MIQALKALLFAAAGFAATAAVAPSIGAAPAAPAEREAHAVPAQYYGGPAQYYGAPPWERCRRLRQRAQELEYRIAYAPPWERDRLQYRLGELRHELWVTCRW